MIRTGNDAMVVRNSNERKTGGLARAAASEGKSIAAGVDARLHLLGKRCRDCLERTKDHYVELAVVLLTAKAELGRIGRGSRLPEWLAKHAPELDRKTVDRLVSIAEAFQLNTDNVSEFKPLAAQFRLTALYRLAGKDVPQRSREEALAAAKAGRLVTLAEVEESIERNTITIYTADGQGRKKRAAQKIYRRTIALPAGKVRLTINHDDYRQALAEALEFVGEDEGKPAESLPKKFPAAEKIEGIPSQSQLRA